MNAPSNSCGSCVAGPVAEDGARMIIQTEQKEHPVLKALIGESDAEDLSAALAERKKFGYPPFVRLVVITLKDKNEKECGVAHMKWPM